ncbi:TonB-dependent receptor [Termitidicoccus mucosus]|uniref:TonB-dependent receptor domain-containing protein n=1 Tax=Termitidicoccus mucosus TaxID=1184151 RepID=UPI002FEE0F2E
MAGTGATTKHVFDLPADSVESAVKKLSRLSGVDVLVPTKIVQGVRTKPVKGEYTAREALEIMLADTDLIVEQDAKTDALTVRPKKSAQATAGGIEGAVYNSTNSLPVARARVAIKGTWQETLTDDDGRFLFADIPAGETTLVVSYLGFDPRTAVVTVEAGKTATCDFSLLREGAVKTAAAKDDDTIILEKFTVVADSAMSAQAIAMNEQRHAASISNVLALEELPGQGFENIGDYVRFLPGVSIIDDGESASQLSLGGFPANMSNIQLDGGNVASTGIDDVARAGGRELSLQDVPMLNIERVEITKVPTPDRPASGLGGSMNLVSKGLLGIKKPRLDYTLTMNLATNDDLSFSGESPQAAIPQLRVARKQPSFSLSAVVPVSKRLAFSAGFSKSWKQLPNGVLTETADWNLWEGVRFTRAAEWDGNGWYKEETDAQRAAVHHGDYPITLNTATWQRTAKITSTENVSAGMEVRLSRRDTLALTFQHREVSEEYTTNRIDISYGSANNLDPVYNSNIPAGADPATTTGNRPTYNNAGTLYSQNGATGTFQEGQNAPFNYNLETATDQLTLRYKHRGPLWNLDGQASLSRATRLRSNRGRGYASGYGTGSNADGVGRFHMVGTGINTTDSILPTVTVATKSDGTPVDPYDGDDYFLNLVRMEEYGRYITDTYQGRFDAERVFSRFFSLRTGAAFSREERDNQRELPTWRMKTRSNGHPMASVFTDDPRYVYHYDLIDDSIDSPIGGVPVRWLSPVKVWTLTQEHPEYFTPYSNNAYENYSNRANNSKLMREDIAAGYLRADLRLFGNRLHAVLGARYERTATDGWVGRTDNNAKWMRDENGNRIRDEINGGYLQYPEGDELYRRQYQVRALHLGKSYDGIYPSVNLNYALHPNLIARAAYARTIGRPNVNDIVSGVTIPELDDDRTTAYRISVCNPGLEPWTADSFHLSFDSYLFKGGFGSIGVYRKYVSNFFATRVFDLVDGMEAELLELGITQSDIEALMDAGRDPETGMGRVELSRKENAGDANLTGFEFSYRQDLLFLPRWLQKTQVWLNYTHLKVAGPNAEEFMGFAPDAFSAGVNYFGPRFSLRISCAYQAETKVRRPVRTTTSAETASLMPPDTFDYQAPHTRWSVTAEYSLSRAFTLFANCSDVFADDIITYRRASDTPRYAWNYQRRVAASYVSIGVKGTF